MGQGAPPENQFLQTLVQFQLQRNIFKVICEQNPSYLSHFSVETKGQGAPPENQFLQTLVQFQLQRNIFIFKVICEQNPSYLSHFSVENMIIWQNHDFTVGYNNQCKIPQTTILMFCGIAHL